MNDLSQEHEVVHLEPSESMADVDFFPIPSKSREFGERVFISSSQLTPTTISKKRAEICKNIGWYDDDNCLFYFSMTGGAFGTCLLRHPEERFEIDNGDNIVIPENAGFYSVHFPTKEFTPAMMIPGVQIRTERPFKTTVDLATRFVELITLIKQKVIPEPYAIVTCETNDTMAKIAEKLGFKRRVEDGERTNAFIILYKDIEDIYKRLKRISERKGE